MHLVKMLEWFYKHTKRSKKSGRKRKAGENDGGRMEENGEGEIGGKQWTETLEGKWRDTVEGNRGGKRWRENGGIRWMAEPRAHIVYCSDNLLLF